MTTELLTAAEAQRQLGRISDDGGRISDALAIATSLTEHVVNFDVIDKELALRGAPPSGPDSELCIDVPAAYEVVLGDVGAWSLRQQLLDQAVALQDAPGDINAGQVMEAAVKAQTDFTATYSVASLIIIATSFINALNAANPDLVGLGVVTAFRAALTGLERFSPSRFYSKVFAYGRRQLVLEPPAAGWDSSLFNPDDGFIVFRPVVGLPADDSRLIEIKQICRILLTHFYADPAAVDASEFPDMVTILAARVWR